MGSAEDLRLSLTEAQRAGHGEDEVVNGANGLRTGSEEVVWVDEEAEEQEGAPGDDGPGFIENMAKKSFIHYSALIQRR